MTNRSISLFFVFIYFVTVIKTGNAIRCYQCSSDSNKESDLCGAYKKFDKNQHVSVDCQSEEAHTPGIFCVKIVEQSPRGFIWDGRWRTVIRRCASVSETGVTGYCNWGHHENGVYWEECYCSEDECNGANVPQSSFIAALFTILSLVVARLWSRTWPFKSWFLCVCKTENSGMGIHEQIFLNLWIYYYGLYNFLIYTCMRVNLFYII